jgi:hypothetical protein
VWDILNKLPTNQDLLAALKDLDKPNLDWDKILDLNAVYKLLYSLQIVDALMESQDSEVNLSLFLSLSLKDQID